VNAPSSVTDKEKENSESSLKSGSIQSVQHRSKDSKDSKEKLEHHRRTVHDVLEISKQRQTAVVNPTRKSNGVDYLPSGNVGSLNNLLNISADESPGKF